MNAEWLRILQQHYPIEPENCCRPQKNKDRPGKSPKGPRPKRSAWNVHKFGGSSFENAESYNFVGSLINKFDGKNLVVVSALYGMTNLLYAVCKRARYPGWEASSEWINVINRVSTTIKVRLGDSPSGFKETRRFAADLIYLSSVLSSMSSCSEIDQESIEQMVVGYGEIWSARLMTHTMRETYNRAAAFLDARDVLVVEQKGLHINVNWELSTQKLKKWFYQCRFCDVLVVTGFIAKNEDGLPTTLKRNGSDFSATIFSVLTKANSVTIWKDVDGMYTADPKKNPDAKFIPVQTFQEAEEASRKGAFVIQADCIEPAKMWNIPIFLRNCFNLACPGTRIGNPIPTVMSDSNEPLDLLMESVADNSSPDMSRESLTDSEEPCSSNHPTSPIDIVEIIV